MKVIIIGGVAGGMSAAARLRRLDEKAEIIIFEKGEYVSFANCGLPYYIGGAITQKQALTLQTPESFNARFNADVRVNTEALSIDVKGKKVRAKDLKTGREFEESYDKLVLSPGAEPVKPPIPGIDNPKIFTLRTIPDTYKIKDFIDKSRPSSAVVVGGGYIGLEMAENLVEAGLEVTIVEALPQVLNVMDHEMAALIKNHLLIKGVKLALGSGVKEFSGGEKGIAVTLENGEKTEADFAVFSIGVKPDTRLAKEAGLKVNRGIQVNAHLQTSDPDIYACGDAVEVLNPVTGKYAVIPLAGPANKQGRMVADNIAGGNKKKYEGTLGTAVLKVFDLAAAVTGVPEKTLAAEKIPYESVIVHPGSHAGYYPGATTISLKLVFSPSDGKILGAQAVGHEMAEKKIDIIAAYMSKQGTVHDLASFEHCYAPPFSSAKDAVNMAGFVAENILEGSIRTISADRLKKEAADFFILDVRTVMEFSGHRIENAVNIPVDSLRERLSEVPKDKKIAVHCGVGIRSYIAARILMQNGFREVYNLSGGFFTYANAAQ